MPRSRLRTLFRSAPPLAALLALSACGSPPPPEGGYADLVLLGGRVVTVDDDLPEAEAVAVRGDRIAAVGDTGDIERYLGPDTEVIPLEGRLAIPGFIEGHGHFMGVGDAQMILKLGEIENWNRIVDLVAEAVAEAPAGTWIQGRGWHQEKWDQVPPGAVEGLPHHLGLSEISPEHPVLLRHASGHAAFANALAMELAGITDATPDPPGGTIVRDADGRATGALRETAQRLVARARDRALAERSDEEIRAEMETRLELAAEESLRKGVTSFQDAGSSFELIAFFREMAEAGRLPIRLYVMVRGESNDDLDARLADHFLDDHANGYLTVRSIKRQVDGALGAHGAWLLAPYDDMPSSDGLVLEELADIEETVRLAIRDGFQVNTHAIGDRGNREILDLYERGFAEAGVNGKDLRFRIEHAQHLHPDDIPRFGELGVVAAMQAVHATSDGPWVPEKLGDERARSGAYPWRALLDSGAVIGNGTDAPVEDLDPIPSFHASITRELADGTRFYPEQAMTRMEALRSYTLDNAWAAFEEEVKGSLTPGKYADIVVLDRDLLTVPEDEVRGARVALTIVGGEVRYRREADSEADGDSRAATDSPAGASR